MKAEKMNKGFLRTVLTVLLTGVLFLSSLWNFAAPRENSILAWHPE